MSPFFNLRHSSRLVEIARVTHLEDPFIEQLIVHTTPSLVQVTLQSYVSLVGNATSLI